MTEDDLVEISGRRRMERSKMVSDPEWIISL
jgi:hypothetical protein